MISINGEVEEDQGKCGIPLWGAYAPSRAGDGALATANFLLSESIATRRRNEHARRVRSPESLATLGDPAQTLHLCRTQASFPTFVNGAGDET